MVRHGVRALLPKPRVAEASAPAPKPAKPKVAKPKAAKPASLKPKVKSQQSGFKSRMKTIAAPKQTATKRQQQTAGVKAIAAWRAKSRKVTP